MKRDAVLGLISVLLIGALSIQSPQFASPRNLAEILDDTAILILLALGQMLVIVTRGVDLSVAANLALSGMVAALIDRGFPQAGIVPTIAVATACGTVLGAFNGVLVWRLRLPAIVVTLATLSIYRGVIYLLTDGAWVNSHEMSAQFLNFVRARFLGLASISWIALLAVAASWICLRFTNAGRNFFVAGGNPQAAAAAGVDSGRMQFFAFVISGALAGLCGYLWVARFAVAYTDIALGFELQVIAACLIAGVSIAGGIGTTVGVLIGCLFLGSIKNALPLLGVSPFWQMGVSGLIITIAAVLNARAERTYGRPILEAEAR
jgi:rhamnose transport system permease protein